VPGPRGAFSPAAAEPGARSGLATATGRSHGSRTGGQAGRRPRRGPDRPARAQLEAELRERVTITDHGVGCSVVFEDQPLAAQGLPGRLPSHWRFHCPSWVGSGLDPDVQSPGLARVTAAARCMACRIRARCPGRLFRLRGEQCGTAIVGSKGRPGSVMSAIIQPSRARSPRVSTSRSSGSSRARRASQGSAPATSWRVAFLGGLINEYERAA
jgi:hypothetical protein